MKRVLISIVFGAFILTTGAALAASANENITETSVATGQQVFVIK